MRLPACLWVSRKSALIGNASDQLRSTVELHFLTLCRRPMHIQPSKGTS